MSYFWLIVSGTEKIKVFFLSTVDYLAFKSDCELLILTSRGLIALLHVRVIPERVTTKPFHFCTIGKA